MNKKKILIVTRNLPPLIGGMERLNWHIADELNHDNDIFLLSHHEAKRTAPPNCIFTGVPLNPLPLFLIFSFIQTLFICLKHKPDILFAGSGLTAPIVVFWAKLLGKKSIVYIHGLDINNSSALYQYLWLPFIRQADRIISNSSPTKFLAVQKGIIENKIHIVHPGVSYPPKHENPIIIEELKNKFNLHQKKILISVGRLTERKGILEFVEKCLPTLVKKDSSIVLIIIGDTANNALNNKFQTQQDIIKIAERNNVAPNIIFSGAVNNEQLTQFYYLANLHVFPVKHIPNDPEGFGMVAIEAAAHGTPTVAFATGGIIDAIQHKQSGLLIQNNEYEQFTHNVLNCQIDANHCKQFASRFSWQNMRNNITNVIKSLE